MLKKIPLYILWYIILTYGCCTDLKRFFKDTVNYSINICGQLITFHKNRLIINTITEKVCRILNTFPVYVKEICFENRINILSIF